LLRLRLARRFLGGSLLVFSVLALTAWNLMRSDNLEAARADYARHDWRDTVRHALDHLDHRPWSREAARLAALGLCHLSDPEPAEAYFARAGRLSDADLHVRGLALSRAERYGEAANVYKVILDRQPGDTVALRRLAAAQLGLGKPDEVLRLADQLERRPNSAVVAATLRAVGHHENKERAQAVAAFERILKLDPSLIEMPLPRRVFWEQLAEDLVAVGRSADARALLARAVDTAPDPHVMCVLGRAYQFEGALDDAERWLLRAVEGDPAYDLPHLYLGQIARQRGKLDDALQHLEKAFERSPRRYETAYNLSLTYQALGRLDRAERWRKQAARLRRARDGPHSGALPAPSS
jgi:tetratricopeptide (TPR) repeat protein